MADNTGLTISTNAKLAEVIYIEFYNKNKFPPGEWMNEPDYCLWESYGYKCIIFRDMKLGMLKGAVGINSKHIAFNKNFDDLIKFDWIFDLMPRGGFSFLGKLPPNFQYLNQNNWWLGFECSQGEDLIPLLEIDNNNPLFMEFINKQTYKGLIFVMREVNKLAKNLAKLK